MKKIASPTCSKLTFCGMAVMLLAGTLSAALQPSESLLFGPGSGHEPRTNGNLEGQAVGFITVDGQRHHALFTAVGQSVTYGMDLLVFDLDTQKLVRTVNIKDTAGAYDICYMGEFLYFATVTRPFLYQYDTTQPSVPPNRLVEIPVSAAGSASWNGYAFGTIAGPDREQAIRIKNSIDISTGEYKAVYLSASYTGHLYRYTRESGLEDLGQIKKDEIYGRFSQTWRNYLVIGTGSLNPSVALYDIALGTFINSMPPDLAGVKDLVQARVYKKLRPDTVIEKGPDLVYVTFDGLNRVIYTLNLAKWVEGGAPSDIWKRHPFPQSPPPGPVTGTYFPDPGSPIQSAMVYRSPDTTKDFLMINSAPGPSVESLGYNGGPTVFAATANERDDFYFSSFLPGYLFSGNLATGSYSERFPYSIGGESYSLMVHTLSNGKRMLYSANYAGGFPLGVTDLADTSKITKISFLLPSGENLPAHWRPRAMVKDSRGMAYIGAQAGYGMGDGYIVRFNPESPIRYVGNPLYSNYYSDAHVLTVPDQSVTALFPSDPYLVGGTMNTVGVGAPVVADSAQLFLYCGQDAGACVGKRDALINTVQLNALSNRDNPAQPLTVTKVFAIAPLGNGQFTATVQYTRGPGYLRFLIDSSDLNHPAIRVTEAVALPGYSVGGNYEYWNPYSLVQVGGNLYAVSSSRIYWVTCDSNRVAYTPLFNTSYHRVDIGGALTNSGNLYYNSEDNVFKWGPVPSGPLLGTPVVTGRTYATVSLSWPAATEVNGTPRYDVERSSSGAEGPFALIASTRATTYKDTGRATDTLYAYRVRVVDEGALQTPLGTFDFRSRYSPTVTARTLSLPAFTESFDSETTGGSPSHWDLHGESGANVTIDQTVFRGLGGKSVHLQDSSSSSYAQIQHLTNASLDTVYFKASVRFKDKNQVSYVFLGNGNKTSLWFLMANNGQWTRSDGATTSRLPGDTGGYEANRWYDVEVEADFAKGTYGVWVDGLSIGQDLPIMGGNTCLTGFRILPAGTPGTGEMWVDDVYYAPQRPALDLIAPRINEIKAQEVTDHSATVAWTTNEEADSRVRWGTTDQVSLAPVAEAGFGTSHRIVLAGLDRSTTYYYQVESMDKSGNLRSSAVQSVVTAYDTTPPIVGVTTPTAGTVISAPGWLTVGATASDPSGVSKVQFLLDGVVVATATAAPYETRWWARGVANGTHTWVARAFDTLGNGGDSAPVEMKLNLPALPSAYGDDFNSDGTGNVPSGWLCVTGPTAKVVVDETVHRGTTGKSVYLLDTSSTTYAQIQHSNSAMDTVYYKASVRFRNKDQVSYVFLGNGNKTSLWFLMANNGQWTRSDGATTSRLPGDTAGYVANRWYDVEVEADFAKGTYGVWVDGISIGQDLPIMGGNTCLTGFRILPAGTPGTGEMWVDDVYYAPQRPALNPQSQASELADPPVHSDPGGIRAYPNPYRTGLGQSGITIDGMDDTGSIRIFTIDGRRVKTLEIQPGGKTTWDLTNSQGSKVASGVYIAIIGDSGSKRIKLVVQN